MEEKDSISACGFGRRKKESVFLVSAHICIGCSSSGISQGHAGKVCQKE